MYNLFLISGDFGSGKTTLANYLVASFSTIVFCPTYTTRIPRKGEETGKDYHFLDVEKFQELKNSDFFLETVLIEGIYYGTSKEILSILKINNVVLVVDIEGIKFWKSSYKNVFSIWVYICNEENRKLRILNRDNTDDYSLKREKFNENKKNLEIKKEYIDFCIENNDLNSAKRTLYTLYENLSK